VSNKNSANLPKILNFCEICLILLFFGLKSWAWRSFENIQKLLKKHNQSHIPVFWGQLDESQRENLLVQIQELDFAKIEDWTSNFVQNPHSL
jgi:hypothetical protein